MINPEGFGGNFAKYLSDMQFPYSILTYPVLACALFILVRRLILQKIRARTIITDFFIIVSILLITLTGMGAEWFSGYDVFVGKNLLNWNNALIILQLHIYTVFLLFIMVIPWTRFKHIITIPLLLLAKRGGE